MNQQPPQRCDLPFVRTAGFLGTMVVQIISRIPPTSSDSLVTIPPPVIGIQDEAQPVETYQPDQVGANYTAHLTVGLATVADLKAMQAEPFDEFDVQPVGLAVYQLGNNGTARTQLKAWPLNT